MNLITRLFGSKNSTPNQTLANGVKVNEVLPADALPMDLFIDRTPPSPNGMVTAQRSIVSDFMDEDFFTAGAGDGYNFHSTEILEARKKEIRSRFLYMIDQAIGEKKSKRLNLQNLLIDIEAISTEMKERVKNTINELEDVIDTLSIQKELSGIDEGWVIGPVRKYHLGFLQGMKDYVDTEVLIGSTNIF